MSRAYCHARSLKDGSGMSMALREVGEAIPVMSG
jgi:hypothetical protein